LACIRKRRGKWVVDYRDGAGIRRWITCETRRQAEAVLSDRLREGQRPLQPSVDPDITVAEYAGHWLSRLTVKPRMVDSYDKNRASTSSPRSASSSFA
jgi:hypothetical protein